MNKLAHLLHPELLSTIPIVGHSIKRSFAARALQAARKKPFTADLTVAIRTLNEAETLKQLLEDIRAQDFAGSLEIVVSDNESTDDSVEIAQSYGATVVTLPREEFSYPKSMNLAVEAVTHEFVFLTVGHAQLLSSNTLQTALNEFKDQNVAAVYGHALPSSNASYIEKLIAMGNASFIKKRIIKKPELGFMAATGLMIRKSVWEELGRFDERYESGGEDGALGALMLNHGYTVIDEPMLSTHHTHGLGFVNTLKQWLSWVRSSRPTQFNRKKYAKRRPDMRIHEK